MSESKLQIAMVKWFRLQHPNHLLMSIPNGGKRNYITAAIMKAEGTVSGAADLFLVKGNGLYHGLFIEVKTPTGRQQPSQKEFESIVTARGYKYVVVRTFDEFKRECENYIKIV